MSAVFAAAQEDLWKGTTDTRGFEERLSALAILCDGSVNFLLANALGSKLYWGAQVGVVGSKNGA